LAPVKVSTNCINRATTSPFLRSKLNRRKYLLKKRSKGVLVDAEKDEI
jgi:hypothetical protein